MSAHKKLDAHRRTIRDLQKKTLDLGTLTEDAYTEGWAACLARRATGANATVQEDLEWAWKRSRTLTRLEALKGKRT
jgi:ribosomal protein S18